MVESVATQVSEIFLLASVALLFLLLASVIVFLIAVTYTHQWPRYWPWLARQIKAREEARVAAEKRKKKWQSKMRKKKEQDD